MAHQHALTLMATLALVFARPATSQATSPVLADASKIAFYPDRWEEAGVDFEMLAWEGDHLVLLTQKGEYDAKKLGAFVDVLDSGWAHQQDLVGQSPRLHKHWNGKPTIVALPKPNLSCGHGCGYVGATGIEASAFHRSDWPSFQKDPSSFAHYYFYEMARNTFVFGDRHSLFTTGYAVFMRYVCMDKLGLKDNDAKTRETIERCEAVYADSDIDFFTAFTNLASGEKSNRLKNANGKTLIPSDQPVMYATAMLKLRKDHGGDAFVKKYLHALRACDAQKATDLTNARTQIYNWVVSASVAAGQDLTPVFVDRWRMPMTPAQRDIMKRVNWEKPDLDVATVVQELFKS